MSNVPMTMPELVIDTQAHPFSHTTTFAQLEDGRIIHCSHHVRQWSDDGGLTWSDVVEMQDINGDPVGGRHRGLLRGSHRGLLRGSVRYDEEQRQGRARKHAADAVDRVRGHALLPPWPRP